MLAYAEKPRKYANISTNVFECSPVRSFGPAIQVLSVLFAKNFTKEPDLCLKKEHSIRESIIGESKQFV